MAESPTARVECGWADVGSADDPGALAPWLAASERKRAKGFSGDARRREFLLGRAVARWLLCRRLGLESGNVALATDAHGRLAVESPAGTALWVSVSHSRGRVAAATSDAGPLGLDIERVRHAPRAFSVARRWFSESECARLAECDGEALDRGFLTLWTLKECQLKATGEGLAGALRAFSFEIFPDGRVRYRDRKRGTAERGWCFRSFEIGQNHVAAVGVRTARLQLDVSAAPVDFA